MDQEIATRLEALETHIALLEGILHVLLQEIENGTIDESVSQIRAALPRLED